jgi:hypothetical protein
MRKADMTIEQAIGIILLFIGIALITYLIAAIILNIEDVGQMIDEALEAIL